MWEDIRVINNNISKGVLSYIYEVYREDKWHELELLGKGASGKVYGYRDYAIKLLKKNERHRDIEVLEFLQGKVSCIPTLYAIISDAVMIMERIKGVTVGRYEHLISTERETSIKSIHPDFNKIYKQGLKEIINAGYSPKDIHRYNVMIEEDTGKPVIIDVGLFKKYYDEPPNFESIDEDEDARKSIGRIYEIMERYINTPEKVRAV